MNTRINYISNSWKRFNWLLAALVLALTVSARSETQPATIPLSDIGARATANYQGDALGVTATADGARLRCGFQKLEGRATPEGLWLESTKPGGAGKLRLTATALGRAGLSTINPQLSTALATTGKVSVNDKLVRFTRPGLTEEYSVSVDGVRQDFVIESPPLNPQRSTLNQSTGDLRVELALSGARAEAAAGGARLRLEGSGRVMTYSRLRVEDATGRELTARLEVLSADRLAVNVADANATYPVRIDPTFSDADWLSLGSGMGGYGDSTVVYALAVSGTNLYVGGFFATAGGVSATNIAKWDGSAWSGLGWGVNNSVYALAVMGTDLYVGGYFTRAGGVSANYVAKWNGKVWSSLGSGMNSWVRALAVMGTDLYVGGYFTRAGGVTAYYVAKWDGNAWSALNRNTSVKALAVSGTDLYAGGYYGINKWDGSAWSALGSGISAQVEALAVSGTDLYAGGSFTTAGGVTANNIAKWDGSAWSGLGSGVNNSVYALAADGAVQLFAGGDFSLAGTKVSPCIAEAVLLPSVPTILSPPLAQTAVAGSTVEFQVEVSGTWPLAYQWFFNATNSMSGGTNTILQLTDLQSSQSGAYSVVVSNAYGSVTSPPAMLTVTVVPVIVAAPTNQKTLIGGTADFSVVAGGALPLVYQWFFGANAILWATNSTLQLTNVQPWQAGGYAVVVTNVYGAATSAPAVLEVFPPGTVVSATEAALRAALAVTQTVTFACDGTITLSDTIVIGTNTVLDGNGHQVTISGNNAVRVFDVNTNVVFKVVNLTIADGTSSGGSAILNRGGTVNATNCCFAGNRATGGAAPVSGTGDPGLGGAIHNSGTVTLDHCTLKGNSATGDAGEDPQQYDQPGFPGGEGSGGAIYNQGTLIVDRTTLCGNSATGGSGGGGGPASFPHPTGYPGGQGGGASGAAICNLGSLWVTCSTFASNVVTGGTGGPGAGGMTYGSIGGNGGNGGNGGSGLGGALFSSGPVSLVNCTIAFNAGGGGAGGPGGGGSWGGVYNGWNGAPGNGGLGSGGVALQTSDGIAANCLLAGNSPDNCTGRFADAGHNLSSDGTCAFTNAGSLNQTDPKLGPLADNGGPTLTMALLPGSPAIDAGNTSLAPATDQRGFPRPAGLAADIGAYELCYPPVLRISAPQAGAISIWAYGTNGQACRLLSSPDLSSWVALATNQIGTNETTLFYDTCAPGSACRYYRLVTP